MPAAGSTAKSDERRSVVIEAAVSCFAHKGYYGTTTHEIAERAGISQPYLYRLFADKEALFVAAVAHVGELLSGALTSQAEVAAAAAPGTVGAMLQDVYSSLIEDEAVLRFLMHANCAVDEPAIGEAVRACYARQVSLVSELLDGDGAAVRAWFAAGMLDNVVTVLGLARIDEDWANTLSGR